MVRNTIASRGVFLTNSKNSICSRTDTEGAGVLNRFGSVMLIERTDHGERGGCLGPPLFVIRVAYARMLRPRGGSCLAACRT